MHRESIHASLVNIHASRVNSCIESRFMHRELIHASLVNIHALRVNIHASQVKFFMHREKIQFLAKVYISQEDFIPCGIYASLEDFIPRKILCIARRSNPSQNFMHREKIPSLAKLAHRGKIFMPCKQSCTARKRIVHLKGNKYPSTSTDVNAEERN